VWLLLCDDLLVKYDPAIERGPLPHAPFKALTVPRPIGWLSTVSADGVANLAPFSQWQNLTFDPPIVMFAANRHSGGVPKDTVRNAEETGWFVWNMATWALRKAVSITAAQFPADVDEFARAGLRAVMADLCPVPMVADSPAHYECKVMDIHRLNGRTPDTAVDVVYATVERLHLDDGVITDDGRVDIAQIRPIARMGYFDYAVIDETFAMRTPEASEAELAGLEGTPRD